MSEHAHHQSKVVHSLCEIYAYIYIYAYTKEMYMSPTSSTFHKEIYS